MTASITINGRKAVAEYIRMAVDHYENGNLAGPPHIVPVPHIGPDAVRVAVDFLGGIPVGFQLPGVPTDGDDFEEPTKP